ncbi:DNA polymerase IV [Sinorhizobium meliloti]|nr:DNA polymerase IV [Sinorhizobium meliloti]
MPTISQSLRKIIHVDMDAFFASVEQRDDPSLKGRPVAVGGSRERSVVAAASYEARRFGVRSAMPSMTARRFCPDLVFVKPRFDVYRQVSSQIGEIFREYTPLVEFLSLDEAYLDVTENLKGIPLARDVARQVRQDIRERTGLTASAGVSYCKFLAKMASDKRKPDGMFVIPPEHGKQFVASLAIGKFHGIGPATAERMKSLGVANGADLERVGSAFLEENFGKAGGYFHRLSLGIDERPVNPERIRKSSGAEETFPHDIVDAEVARREAVLIAEKVWDRCERYGSRGRTVVLKIKFEDFEEISRSKTSHAHHADRAAFVTTAISLLETVFPLEKGIRLIGVTMAGLDEEIKAEASPQLDLFAVM